MQNIIEVEDSENAPHSSWKSEAYTIQSQRSAMFSEIHCIME